MSLSVERRNPFEVRRRLFDPPNAVADRPLVMRNGAPVRPVVVFQMPSPIAAAAELPPVVTEPPAPPPDTPMRSGPLVNDIIKAVAAHYKLAVRDLISNRRTANLVRPRHIAMWLAKELTTQSMPYIGLRMNGRDHTTIMHGIRKIEALREIDAELQNELNVLVRKLSPQSPLSPEFTE